MDVVSTGLMEVSSLPWCISVRWCVRFDSTKRVELPECLMLPHKNVLTSSLDAKADEAASARARRPSLSLQYMVRPAIQRFLDENEGCAIMVTSANALVMRYSR